MSADVICLGHTALDYSWQVPALSDLPQGGGKCKADDFAQAGGGMAATAAVAVARLGLAVQFWGRAGADPAGKDMRAELEHWGVEVSHLRLFEGAQSSVSAIVVDAKGERLIINHRGNELPTSADWLPLQNVKTAKAVLADPRWPEGAQALFTAARQHGVPTVFDADVADPSVYAQLLPLCDHALFSEPGLAIWSAHNRLIDASTDAQLRAVQALGCPVAGVTLGERGVQWADAQGFHHMPARPVRAIDTTGAGDVFHGAYAAALALGRSTAQAIAFASAAAALKCQQAGGRPGIPDMAQTMAFNNSSRTEIMSNPPKLPLGKQWGLRRMANAQGHFTMVALDQRPPIIDLIAAKRGVPAADVQFADVVAVKHLLVEVLGPHASAMLLDPNYAFPAALETLPARTGLVVTLEEHKFEETPHGRRSANIANWSVEKIKRAGGDGVKVLAWYRPDAAPEICAHQQAYVKAIGAASREHDIPFVFELLVYPFPASSSHTTDYVEAPEKMPALVLNSVREFAKPEYGVDLFKLESPLAGASLPARDGGAAHLAAQAHFDAMGRICADAGIPWVMLSAGVTSAQFLRVMEYAYAAGANGFLAGRAIWYEALQAYPDLSECKTRLEGQGPQTLKKLGELTASAGRAWRPNYSGFESISREGDLCMAYS